MSWFGVSGYAVNTSLSRHASRHTQNIYNFKVILPKSHWTEGYILDCHVYMFISMIYWAFKNKGTALNSMNKTYTFYQCCLSTVVKKWLFTNYTTTSNENYKPYIICITISYNFCTHSFCPGFILKKKKHCGAKNENPGWNLTIIWFVDENSCIAFL